MGLGEGTESLSRGWLGGWRLELVNNSFHGNKSQALGTGAENLSLESGNGEGEVGGGFPSDAAGIFF